MCCRQRGDLPICSQLAEGDVLPRTAAGAEALPGQLQRMGSLLKGPLLHCHAHLPLLQGMFMESDHGHTSASCFGKLSSTECSLFKSTRPTQPQPQQEHDEA